MVAERELLLALRAALDEDVPPGGCRRLPHFRDSAVGALLARQDEPDVRALGILTLAVLAALGRVRHDRPSGHAQWQQQRVLERLLSAINRRRLHWTDRDVERLAPLVAHRAGNSWTLYPWTPSTARLLVTAAECSTPSTAVIERLDDLAGLLTRVRMGSADERGRLVSRIRRVVGASRGERSFDLEALLTDADPWARATNEMLTDLEPTGDLTALLEHLPRSGLRASAAWQSKCVRLIAAASQSESCLQALVHALPRLELEPIPGGGGQLADLVDATNVGIARGALWATALGKWTWSSSALRDVGIHCATSKGGGATPRSEKLANGSILALGALGDDNAISALVAIRIKAKKVTLRKQIDGVLRDAAGKAGITEPELLERAVPTLDLSEDGVREQPMGSYTARVWLAERGPKLGFVDATGHALRTTPARLRTEHANDLAALRKSTRDAQKTFATERSRIEDLFAESRTWDYDTWTRRYLRHPLTGFFARQLIWIFEVDDTVMNVLPLSTAEFVDANGMTLTSFPEATSVRLWHPAGQTIDDVEAWRNTLVDRTLRQPFKQAFREIYLVTPAELDTNTYSNRYAGHILRYPQAYALMRARHWNASSLGDWECGDHGHAAREFPVAGLRSVFYYQLVEHEYTGSETPRICSTDQVRFEHLDEPGTAIPVASVPPLVFSEAMRDVDLFVGVTSIASDPHWIDAGPDAPFASYWQEQSFGELTASAEVRHQALERLVPQTKIADRCTLTDRFLVVRGDLRTYKIHIGSGNIRMEPNDQYLCIVSRRGEGPGRLFLPFEEDGGLLSAILSKAFLLADDRNITDETILQQIARERV